MVEGAGSGLDSEGNEGGSVGVVCTGSVDPAGPTGCNGRVDPSRCEMCENMADGCCCEDTVPLMLMFAVGVLAALAFDVDEKLLLILFALSMRRPPMLLVGVGKVEWLPVVVGSIDNGKGLACRVEDAAAIAIAWCCCCCCCWKSSCCCAREEPDCMAFLRKSFPPCC